jgi:hypothetical protein
MYEIVIYKKEELHVKQTLVPADQYKIIIKKRMKKIGK